MSESDIEKRVRTLEAELNQIKGSLASVLGLAEEVRVGVLEQRTFVKMSVLVMLNMMGAEVGEVTKKWYEFKEIAEKLS